MSPSILGQPVNIWQKSLAPKHTSQALTDSYRFSLKFGDERTATNRPWAYRHFILFVPKVRNNLAVDILNV